MSDNAQDSDDRAAQSTSDAASPQPSMTMHPITTYSGMPMHMYPFPPGMVPTQPARTKRRQVKNACTNCQKACKKCDDARPCLRCVKYGIAEECVDSQRKERQKGIKRGPYKKRDGKANSVDPIDMSAQPAVITPAAIAAASANPPMPYVAAPLGYPAGFFGQYPTAPPTKPGEAPAYYPQYYFAPIPMPPPQVSGQDGEAPGYPAGFYPATFLAPYAPQHYPGAAMQYMLPAPPPGTRADGQPIVMAPPPTLQYAYSPQAYPKPPAPQPQSPTPREAGQEMGHQGIDPNGARRDPRMEGYSGAGMSSVSGHVKAG
ncbi:hypothetical protein PHLGIDRAFT_37209 [Phlebiopsis gigantea 11061_1 CR5-6]|uniref:Transcription activator of gluconeogenesis ERT1 n=1 Tax=Phlebiopsis gigantea (strain 11061_1 CR5-6) TaxID=745531 RepID=A0A0C3RTC2_PHLG1|nr:hypothetical protein PHLGIDRAFT_37209 [Phlebiopsis gigantea 11061_1 CR5-6]